MALTIKIDLLILFLIMLVMSINKSDARPGHSAEWGSGSATKVDKCPTHEDVIETCQRCAKDTKSPIVYPMCCSNDDDAFFWCQRYINYGLGKNKLKP